ncbi:adenosylcobinamide amidohydrolase [Peribacillus sp. FSL H8-0477]|uniref:adenosylcobinamide amidohydrolase n=1 Tax=Peribacillus sp. FSL H8-0477 TaxID=2921388 RepID=UPI0030FCFA28
MLKVKELTGGYAEEPVIHSLSFAVRKGELFGILGPNGSGKTTLLHMISGIMRSDTGSIYIKGLPIQSYSAKQLARTVAVLPQHSSQTFSYTVKETVSLGRYAHQSGWLNTWTEEDERIVQEVMEQTGVLAFQDKSMNELSGGEIQRVMLSQALAQQPEILLLDEPTNHLDLSYQKDLLDMMKKWSVEKGLTVISIFHDLNLAALYCDNLLLLEKGRIQIIDTPNNVLQQERIQHVYKTKIEKHPHPVLPKPQMFIVPEKQAGDNQEIKIEQRYVTQTEEYISLRSPIPLRTMSSGVTGAGTGWYDTFVNRHVNHDYNCEDHLEEMNLFLQERGFDPAETVGMMTAVDLRYAVYQFYQDRDFSIFIIVTAGVGNAVDASRASEHTEDSSPGTINTWIFINAKLAEEAFIHSIVTATEAKVKALMQLNVMDYITHSSATGTSTDSVLVAATQRGTFLPYGGTATPLGKLIGKGVYECTMKALQKNQYTREDE